jgi:hypothetical protein
VTGRSPRVKQSAAPPSASRRGPYTTPAGLTPPLPSCSTSTVIFKPALCYWIDLTAAPPRSKRKRKKSNARNGYLFCVCFVSGETPWLVMEDVLAVSETGLHGADPALEDVSV